jgi:beta-lactamase class A
VSFAVIDSRGRLLGHRANERFYSASVVKAMLLIARLRQLERSGQSLDPGTRAQLEAMIVRSANEAADAVHGSVGDAGLHELARRVGMTQFSGRGYWANATVSASDQARLFARLNRVTPRTHRRLARSLLASVVPEQRWGLPRAAGRRWRVRFKGGWRPSASGRLVHQAARLERGRTAIAIAVLTDGNPSHAYGVETVRGIGARLLDSDRRSRLGRRERSFSP